MTAVEWLVSNLDIIWEEKIIDLVEQAKQMEKQQIMKAYYDGHGLPANKTQQKNYYNETYGSKGSDERIVDTNKTIISQTEISDDEICKQAEIEYPFGDYDRDNWLRRRGFIKGMIKYREQLKKK